MFTDVFRSRPLLCTIHPVPQLLASTRGDELSRALCLTWDIRDSILVDDDRADQSTELDKRVPVAAIAGETRRLDRKHGTDVLVANCGKQPIEPGASCSTARPAEIVIDDFDAAPSELLGTIGKPVLPPSALVVVRQLIWRRLADIDVCFACKCSAVILLMIILPALCIDECCCDLAEQSFACRRSRIEMPTAASSKPVGTQTSYQAGAPRST